MPNRRMLILTSGCLDVFTAKTAVMLLRYCPDEVVAVLDAEHVGQDLHSIIGVGQGVPIVDSVEAGLSLQPDHLVIGAVFPGGVLPATWRASVKAAVGAGLHVLNGLHTPIALDPEIAEAAEQGGAMIYDLRQVARQYPVGLAKAAQTRAKRVLTVGSDCNLGKMVTSMEIVRELRRRGFKAEFVATGQTGVMVAGRGEVLDAVKSDFISGAVEALVLEADDQEPDFIVVEGQGGLLHPGFSGVTLGLVHGVLPDQMILCHDPTRRYMRHTEIAIPPLRELIDLHLAIMAPIRSSSFTGVALNTVKLDETAAKKAIAEASAETGLPAVDCLRTDIAPLIDAVLKSTE